MILGCSSDTSSDDAVRFMGEEESDCPKCGERLVFGEMAQIRLDLQTIKDAYGAEDPDQRCEMDIQAKICLSCSYAVLVADLSAYAGF